jgi:hypothetical protein
MARLTQLLTTEHEELLGMLDACVTRRSGVDRARFDAFRRRALRHIAVEQRVLLPALGRMHKLTDAMRNAMSRDHRALVMLCVPEPNIGFVRDLQELLAWQVSVQESAGGVFKVYDAFVRDEHALDKALAGVPAVEPPAFAAGADVAVAVQRVLKSLGLEELKTRGDP